MGVGAMFSHGGLPLALWDGWSVLLD
jgi:hypothetical protein